MGQTLLDRIAVDPRPPAELQPISGGTARAIRLHVTSLVDASAAKVRSPFFDLGAGYARTIGVDPPPAAREHSVPAFVRRSEHLAEACRDRHVGISLARWIPRGTYELVEYAARSSATVLDALRICADYAALMNDRLRMRVVEGDGEIKVEHWIEGEPCSLGRHFDEFAMTTAVRFLAEVAISVRVTRVHLVHARDASADASAHFDAPVRYGQDRNALVIRRSDGDRRLRTPDGPLSRLLCQLSARAIEETETADLVTRTRSAIARNLETNEADISTVARSLALSVRTLERRLH
ncbi:hypothetical protein BH09MYX1_BH09MYX1_56560 [soil metagenome]